MEHGDASGTGVYDPTHRRWDRSAMDAIDPRLASCFPDRLMGPNEAVGATACFAGWTAWLGCCPTCSHLTAFDPFVSVVVFLAVFQFSAAGCCESCAE